MPEINVPPSTPQADLLALSNGTIPVVSRSMVTSTDAPLVKTNWWMETNADGTPKYPWFWCWSVANNQWVSQPLTTNRDCFGVRSNYFNSREFQVRLKRLFLTSLFTNNATRIYMQTVGNVLFYEHAIGSTFSAGNIAVTFPNNTILNASTGLDIRMANAGSTSALDSYHSTQIVYEHIRS